MVEGFTVDAWGNITKVDNTGGQAFDVIYNKDDYKKGKRDYDESGKKSGIKVEREFLASKKTSKISNQNSETGETTPTDDTLDWYTSKNDDKATTVFEFLSKNTKVEWGNKLLEHNDGHTINLIMTSHERESITGGMNVFYQRFERKGYSIKRSDHSHPDTPKASDPDKEIKRSYPNAQYRIYFQNKYYPY